MKTSILIIMVCITACLAVTYALTQQPPSQYITVCDASHTALLPVITFINTGSVSIPVTNMIDMADKLNVKDLEITVSLKDLRRAKKKYEETEREEEIE